MKNFKFIAIILTLIMAFCGAGGCSPTEEKRDKYEGELSTTVFDTVEDAALGFFTEQIKGESEEYVYKQYVLEGEMSSGNIRDLDLGEMQDEEVLYAEKGAIHFTVGEEKFSNGLCIVQTEDGFYYYALMPNDGEMVTNSYYGYFVADGVFDNVTVKTESRIVIEEDGHSKTLESDVKLLIDGLNIKFEVVTKTYFNGGISETRYKGYVLKEGEEIKVLGYNGEDVVDMSKILSDIFSPEHPSGLYFINAFSNNYIVGHDLFRLEDKKFTLRADKQRVLAQNFLEDCNFIQDGDVESINYEVEFSRGRITAVTDSVKLVSQTVNSELSLVTTKTFTAYGTTVVEVPEDIKSF